MNRDAHLMPRMAWLRCREFPGWSRRGTGGEDGRRKLGVQPETDRRHEEDIEVQRLPPPSPAERSNRPWRRRDNPMKSPDIRQSGPGRRHNTAEGRQTEGESLDQRHRPAQAQAEQGIQAQAEAVLAVRHELHGPNLVCLRAAILGLERPLTGNSSKSAMRGSSNESDRSAFHRGAVTHAEMRGLASQGDTGIMSA